MFYVPEHDDWEAVCQIMEAAGFKAVTSYNPYWEQSGKTFEDIDGYRVVVENSQWEE